MDHRVYGRSSTRIYWRSADKMSGSTVAAEEHNATSVVLQVGPDFYGNNLDFKWPDDRLKVEKLERILEAAFDAGRNDAKKEIRDVLGVEARRP